MRRVTIAGLTLILLALTVAPALAYQPFFEEEDVTAEKPWLVAKPTVSTAIYATLDSRTDVDYFVFDGKKGQTVLLSIVIPQIAGQESFAPTMALMGPGLGSASLPAKVVKPADSSVYLLPALTGPAKTFYEPFGRKSYWERQEELVILPADGRYTVAVWSDEAQVGRYTFVVGDREIPGGDPAYGRKMAAYWTPVPAPAPEPVRATPAITPTKMSGCGEEFRTW
jgi:hypothetical protein